MNVAQFEHKGVTYELTLRNEVLVVLADTEPIGEVSPGVSTFDFTSELGFLSGKKNDGWNDVLRQIAYHRDIISDRESLQQVLTELKMLYCDLEALLDFYDYFPASVHFVKAMEKMEEAVDLISLGSQQLSLDMGAC